MRPTKCRQRDIPLILHSLDTRSVKDNILPVAYVVSRDTDVLTETWLVIDIYNPVINKLVPSGHAIQLSTQRYINFYIIIRYSG